MKLKLGLLCTCVGFSVLSSASAGAVTDLTGTYEGKLRCTTTTDGVVAKTKTDVSIGVVDFGAGEGVTFEIVGVADRIVGLLIEDAVKSDRGILPAVSCEFSDFEQEGVVARLEARDEERRGLAEGPRARHEPLRQVLVELPARREARVDRSARPRQMRPRRADLTAALTAPAPGTSARPCSRPSRRRPCRRR